MADFGTILQGLGALAASNPVTVLINRIADARDAKNKPQRMLLEAQTERAIKHDNAVAEVETELAIKQLRERAEQRVLSEALRDQQNIEAPLVLAISNIRPDAKPGEIDEDWLANFTDKCRLISNEDMQVLWGQILAGEANVPGSFSIRTVNFLATLSQKEAIVFRSVCSYVWSTPEGALYPIIFNIGDQIPVPLNFDDLIHLKSIGLIDYVFSAFSRGSVVNMNKLKLRYGTQEINIERIENESDPDNDKSVYLGGVSLTQLGKEIASICAPLLSDAIIDYAVGHLISDKHIITCPLPSPESIS